MLPQRIRTYVIINVVLAVLMAIVMAVRTDLRSGRHRFIDLGLILFFSASLASLTLGPFALVEIYLYRKKKGVWYVWKTSPARPSRESALSADVLKHNKSEAYRARLSRGDPSPADNRDRTRLFEANAEPDSVSRAALLMSVADKLERSGKREAARRCYQQIAQRFADSGQATEAARRLASSTDVEQDRAGI